MADLCKYEGKEGKTCSCFRLPVNKNLHDLCYLSMVSLAHLILNVIIVLCGLQTSGLMCRSVLTSCNNSARGKGKKVIAFLILRL